MDLIFDYVGHHKSGSFCQLCNLPSVYLKRLQGRHVCHMVLLVKILPKSGIFYNINVLYGYVRFLVFDFQCFQAPVCVLTMSQQP